MSETRPRVQIVYCTQCRWLLRAAWMAQELLTTFEQELGEVALRPGTGGIFEVRLDDELLWSRKQQGAHPELVELKRMVRDRIAPDRNLGHSDRRPAASDPARSDPARSDMGGPDAGAGPSGADASGPEAGGRA